MTFFGLIWLLIVGYCFIQKGIKHMTFITLLFMTFQCVNVISFEGFAVGPQIVTSALFVIKAMLHNNFVIKLDKRNLGDGILWLMFVMILLFSSVYNSVFVTHFLYILQLIIYIMAFRAFISVKQSLDKEFVYNSLRTITIFLLIVGFVQLFTTMEILPLRWLLEPIFYNETSNNVLFHRIGYERIMSTFMEPSFFSLIVVGMFYYFLVFSDRLKKNIFLLTILFITLILTQSSSAYGAFAIVGGIFLLLNKSISFKWRWLGFFVAVIGFALIYLGFYDLLDTVIFSKFSSGSGITRARWDNEAIELFNSSPLIGVGYKNARASSLFYSGLAQLGVLGFGVFLIIMLRYFMPIISFKSKKNYTLLINDKAVRFALLSAFICLIIAVPDLDMSSFWFWMYAFAIASHLKEKGDSTV